MRIQASLLFSNDHTLIDPQLSTNSDHVYSQYEVRRTACDDTTRILQDDAILTQCC